MLSAIDQSKATKEVKIGLRNAAGEAIDTMLKKQAYVTVEVCSRADESTQKAFIEAEKAINALRFLEDTYGSEYSRFTGFGISPTPVAQRQDVIVLDPDSSWWSRGGQWIGPVMAQNFEKVEIQKMKASASYKRLNAMLKSQKHSDIESRLLSAMMWFGEGKVETNTNIAFLKFVVALEVLLSYPKKDQHEGRVSVNICERLAFILTSKPDAANRARIIKNMKALYDTRSGIVHTGTKQVSNEHLKLAKAYSFAVIDRLLRSSKFSNAEELAKWVDLQKMK